MDAKTLVSALFERWEQGDSGPFFAALAEDLIWTARGTTPISGAYHGKANYIEKVYQPLPSLFRRILGDGDSMAVEWHGETPTASGSIYSQDYCWIIRVSEDKHAIQEVTGYFDTALVDRLLSPRTGSIDGTVITSGQLEKTDESAFPA